MRRRRVCPGRLGLFGLLRLAAGAGCSAGTGGPDGELGPLSLRRCRGLTPKGAPRGVSGAAPGGVGGVWGTARSGLAGEEGPPPLPPCPKGDGVTCRPSGGGTGLGFPAHLEVVCITYSSNSMGAGEGCSDAGGVLGTLLLVGLTGAWVGLAPSLGGGPAGVGPWLSGLRVAGGRQEHRNFGVLLGPAEGGRGLGGVERRRHGGVAGAFSAGGPPDSREGAGTTHAPQESSSSSGSKG